MSVVIDGVEVNQPKCLTFDEMSRLATYNGERSRGIAHDSAMADVMRQLQLRFDWFGYFTSDGVDHVGHRAMPDVLTCPAPRRGWLLRRSSR